MRLPPVPPYAPAAANAGADVCRLQTSLYVPSQNATAIRTRVHARTGVSHCISQRLTSRIARTSMLRWGLSMNTGQTRSLIIIQVDGRLNKMGIVSPRFIIGHA